MRGLRKILPSGRISRRPQVAVREGRDACPAKQIPEGTLFSLASGVLGLKDFDADAFNSRIKKMRITAPNTVRFFMRDGKEAEARWQDRSRRDSWTVEMKTIARERSRLKG